MKKTVVVSGVVVSVVLAVLITAGYIKNSQDSSEAGFNPSSETALAEKFFSGESEDVCSADNIAAAETATSDVEYGHAYNVYFGIAACHRLNNNYDQSLSYLEKAKQLAQDNQDEEKVDIATEQISAEQIAKDVIEQNQAADGAQSSVEESEQGAF